MEKILLVSVEPAARACLETEGRQLHLEVQTAPSWSAAQYLLSCSRYDLAFCEWGLEGLEGEVLLRQWQEVPSPPPLILLVDARAARAAASCLGGGAIDLLIKPVTGEQVCGAVRRAQNHLRLLRVNERLMTGAGLEGGAFMLGNSPAMDRLRQLVRKVARTDATVLIQGEPGSGKDFVAHQIYCQSTRTGGPWLNCDCAALSAEQVEAELFGQTLSRADCGAVWGEGLLELADRGILLLKEVGELPPSAQARLLGFLQTQRLSAGGSSPDRRVDVRLFVTTSRRLETLVGRGMFDEELYYRLNIVPIQIPPLRDRLQDLPLLAEHFRQRYARKHGVEALAISGGALRALQGYAWPGNVRELQQAVERAVLCCPEGSVLDAKHFALPEETGEADDLEVAPGERPVPATLHELEKNHIFVALDHCHGNRTRAARVLGISIRTLRNKLREYRQAEALGATRSSVILAAEPES